MLKKLLRQRYAHKRRIEASPSKARSGRGKEVAGRNKTDHVRVKGSSNQKIKVVDQGSKQQALQLQAELRKQKHDDDMKKFKQEMLEILEAFQRKKQVTRQSLDNNTNEESMVHKENIEAKSTSQLSLKSSCEPKQCKSSNFSKYKGATCYICREKGHIAATCPGKIDLNIISAEPKLNSIYSSSEEVSKCVEHSNSCVMHLFLSRDVDAGNTLEHENGNILEITKGENQLSVPTTSQASLELVEIESWDRFSHSGCDKMELELYTSSKGVKFGQSSQHEVTIFSNLLQSTQVSLVYESIQYLNNNMNTRGFKQTVLNFEISSIIHLILSLSAKEDAGCMTKSSGFERTISKRSLPMNHTEQPTQFVQEPFLLPFPCDYPRKHCKEIDLVGNEPILFVIVSTEEEKRFGLENVKEFCVSSSDFDKMISSFETLTLETFSKQMGFMVNDFLEHTSSSRVSLSCNIFELLKTDTNVALFSTWSELDCMFKNLLIEPYKLRDHMLEHNHSKMTLGASDNKNLINAHLMLFL